jgi:hypothetical protein
VHALSVASPETRKQGDFNLRYQWDEMEASVGGGISVENDYESCFGNLGLRKDFNQKQTSVNLGLSYTNSDTAVKLGEFDLTYIDTNSYRNQVSDVEYSSGFIPKSATVGGIGRIGRRPWG